MLVGETLSNQITQSVHVLRGGRIFNACSPEEMMTRLAHYIIKEIETASYQQALLAEERFCSDAGPLWTNIQNRNLTVGKYERDIQRLISSVLDIYEEVFIHPVLSDIEVAGKS